MKDSISVGSQNNCIHANTQRFYRKDLKSILKWLCSIKIHNDLIRKIWTILGVENIASKKNTQWLNKKEPNSIGVELIVSKQNTKQFNNKYLKYVGFEWIDH